MGTLTSAVDRQAARGHLRTELVRLVGAGDRIMLFTLPFAVAGLAANVRWPALFSLGLGGSGFVLGSVLFAVGVPLWFVSAIQILLLVPRGKLITRGPFALVRHPLYTSVALLVVPGAGLFFDSWLGVALGVVLYFASRHFGTSEETELAARFGAGYAAYRQRVLLPWL